MSNCTQQTSTMHKNARVGIMGGTFDPIHCGHLAAACAAAEQLGLEKVVFIPAGTPSFKRDCAITPGNIRLSLCRAALEGYDAFALSDAEIVRGGITYTAQTLKELTKNKRDEESFVFILGADSASTLLRWRDQETLKRLASYAIVTRAGQEVKDSVLSSLRTAGYSIEIVSAQTPRISSTDIRKRVATQKDISHMVPAGVLRIIQDAGLYKELDVFSDAFFEKRKLELQKRVSEQRFEHSLGVANTCVHLARVYGVDITRARLAGILHDWDKNYDDAGIQQRADELGLHIDPFVYCHLPRVLHAHTAAAFIHRVFPSVPTDVLRAIDRHTIAACDMSALDMVLYIADAIEPHRTYPEADDLRALVGTISLEALFFNIYEFWIIRMMQRHMLLHPNTVEVWNCYAARLALAKNTGMASEKVPGKTSKKTLERTSKKASGKAAKKASGKALKKKGKQ